MITFLKSVQLFMVLSVVGAGIVHAHQRVIKGTVYQDGKPAPGVHVTVDKSKAGYYTSFDGKYEVKADSKSKWIKFSFPDKETKIDLDPNGSDYIDCGTPANGDDTRKLAPLQNKTKQD